MLVKLFKSKDSKNKSTTFLGLLPYPLLGLIGFIPGVSSLPFLSFILNPFINIPIDATYLFIILSILISITNNRSIVTLKKIFLISLFIAIVSFLYQYVVEYHLFYFLEENKPTPPFANLLPPYIYNSITQIAIPALIVLLTLIIIFKKLKFRYFILISITATLLTTQWSNLYIIVHESKSNEQRYKTEQAGSRITKGITHQIVGEELINDPNSKYKLLQINTKINVPETAIYTIYQDLRDVTDRNVAVQAYINGQKQTTNNINISLNKGENLVTFDFPYVYFNDYEKRDVVNLPYKDTATGSYGPYNFTFTLYPSKTNSFNAKEAEPIGINWLNVTYKSPVYRTTKVYNYADFYQR